jgi:hypothetical protein
VVRLPVRQFSKLVVSATHPNFQNFALAGANIGSIFQFSKCFTVFDTFLAGSSFSFI